MHRAVRVCALAATAGALLVATACGSDAPTATDVPAGADPALHAALPEEVREAGVIRFAGDSHPPYRTVQPDGSVTGIDRDFQDALGRVLGVRTETQIVDGLPAALQGMLAGRYDAFNGPVKATAEREQQFDTVTWMTTRTSYVVPAGSQAGLAGPEDLCAARPCVRRSSVSRTGAPTPMVS
jgi:polar amino acid transport system substrate-binding protein